MTQTGEKIILYTTPNCSACDQARADLMADGADFEERSVMARQDWFDEVLKYSISVPVIIRGTRVEVGWKGDMGCPIS
jgi:glutaredoxin